MEKGSSQGDYRQFTGSLLCMYVYMYMYLSLVVLEKMMYLRQGSKTPVDDDSDIGKCDMSFLFRILARDGEVR